MSYCRCHGRPYSECPTQAIVSAMPRSAPPGNIYNVLEFLERARIEAMRYEELFDVPQIRYLSSKETASQPYVPPVYMRVAALIRELELGLRSSVGRPAVLRMHELEEE